MSYGSEGAEGRRLVLEISQVFVLKLFPTFLIALDVYCPFAVVYEI